MYVYEYLYIFQVFIIIQEDKVVDLQRNVYETHPWKHPKPKDNTSSSIELQKGKTFLNKYIYLAYQSCINLCVQVTLEKHSQICEALKSISMHIQKLINNT